MSNEPQNPNPHDPAEAPEAPFDSDLRPHSYDGIQEYDKRLPNWWLFTLYGSIVFAIGYWSLVHHWHLTKDPGQAVTEEIAAARAAAARASGELTDTVMWQLSRDTSTVAAGQATFTTTCVACHGEHLEGKIGPTLIKEKWIHGGTPLEIIHTITTGVPPKGMPTWGPVLGPEKIKEVAAFILSHRQPPTSPAATSSVN
jgi:cytochrome c oxidase cbb3-type subunit 3